MNDKLETQKNLKKKKNVETEQQLWFGPYCGNSTT